MTIFIISSGGKKIVYAPCDVKLFPKSERFRHADVLIIGNTIVGDVLKDGFAQILEAWEKLWKKVKQSREQEAPAAFGGMENGTPERTGYTRRGISD